MGFWGSGLASAESERKARQYGKLVSSLTKRLAKHEQYVEKVSSVFRSYQSKASGAGLPGGKTPTEPYEPKRLEKDEEFSSIISKEKASVITLSSAIQKASERQEYYQELAEKQRRAEEAARKHALEEQKRRLAKQHR